MGEALRRILWLVPLLVLGAVGLFGVFGSAASIQAQLDRPLFYNPSPASAEIAALDALAQVSAGNEAGATALAKLGGAALPHVLPRLERLSIDKRRHVALALSPVAHRMGLEQNDPWLRSTLNDQASADKNKRGDTELVFWERYKEDHSLDFRPLIVQRLVRRLTSRELSLREKDLLVLDTYALPALVEQLGRVDSEDDVVRVRRLLPLLAHTTGQDWSLPAHADIDAARDVATTVRRYWDKEGAKWTQLDRFDTLAASLSQTEFAIWLSRTGRELVRLDSPLLIGALLEAGKPTLGLMLLALLGALVLGPATAGVMHLTSFSQRAWRAERVGPRAALALALAFLVPGTILHAPASPIGQGLLAVTLGSVTTAFLLHRELSDRLDWRSHTVLRARRPVARVAAVGSWLAPSIPTYAPIVVAELAIGITCVEVSSGSTGLGSRTVIALRDGDIAWLMAVCLALGIATGGIQVFSDALLGSAAWRKGES